MLSNVLYLRFGVHLTSSESLPCCNCSWHMSTLLISLCSNYAACSVTVCCWRDRSYCYIYI